MIVDRQRWRENLAHASKEIDRRSRAPREAALLQVAKAAPKMEALTNSVEWNEFLARLQAQLESAHKMLDVWRQKLLHPQHWEPADLTQAKSMMLVMQERIDTLTMVIDLPKNIIEAGKAADELLGKSA